MLSEARDLRAMVGRLEAPTFEEWRAAVDEAYREALADDDHPL